ncbi:MAG: flagellar biosynthesis protein FliQ [Rickettsiales bacterium]|jgi:flagellar biosynthetic protein FliQ|nr:flagellar biosynthesis protein FliQ [Rickettsiales bacterium]
MEPAEIFAISSDALYVMILISAPSMLAALIIGLIISLFQALTQIQEQTLTFVPKILVVFMTLALSMSFMFNQLSELNTRLHDKIVHID